MYHLSGQIEALAQYKDGKPDGLWTWWYRNGQKRTETTYKDGEPVSQKSWPSKGEEAEK